MTNIEEGEDSEVHTCMWTGWYVLCRCMQRGDNAGLHESSGRSLWTRTHLELKPNPSIPFREWMLTTHEWSVSQKPLSSEVTRALQGERERGCLFESCERHGSDASGTTGCMETLQGSHVIDSLVSHSWSATVHITLKRIAYLLTVGISFRARTGLDKLDTVPMDAQSSRRWQQPHLISYMGSE